MLNSKELDIYFMEEALKEAKKAYLANEVPVGAIIVYKDSIIARGHNLVESQNDATAHAEMLCIRAASKILQNWRLQGACMYSTLEPCAMCAAAMLNTRLSKIVWGAKDCRVGANGSWIDLFALKHPLHQLVIEKGICRKEAENLMQTFFQNLRSKKKLCKTN